MLTLRLWKVTGCLDLLSSLSPSIPEKALASTLGYAKGIFQGQVPSRGLTHGARGRKAFQHTHDASTKFWRERYVIRDHTLIRDEPHALVFDAL